MAAAPRPPGRPKRTIAAAAVVPHVVAHDGSDDLPPDLALGVPDDVPADAASDTAVTRTAEAAPPPAAPLDTIAFRERLAAWYATNARALPWRGIQNPYATWLSEIMLQQTRVATVINRYKEFLLRFPTLPALAAAREEDVLALWSGLGYYRRARMLLRGAQFVGRELGGELPRTSAELKTLPGIGDYTAAAIASIAFGESVAVVDGNVERVLMRVLGQPEDRSAKARTALARVAQALVPAATDPPATGARGGRRKGLPANPPGDHNQAMMELGATVCLPRAPLCLQCPVLALCATRGEHITAPRAKLQCVTVAHLLALRKRGVRTEVLLQRRAADAGQMADMLELPPLEEAATHGLEPVLRVRHAITNTNYYVQVFATSAPDGPPPDPTLEDSDDEQAPAGGVGAARAAETQAPEPLDPEAIDEDALTYQADAHDLAALAGSRRSLLHGLQPSESLQWCDTARLPLQPLTGLTRKALQRLDVMSVPAVRLAGERPGSQ